LSECSELTNSDGIILKDVAASESSLDVSLCLLDAVSSAVGHTLIRLFLDDFKLHLVAQPPLVLSLLRDQLLRLRPTHTVSLLLRSEVLDRILRVKSVVQRIQMLSVVPDRRGLCSSQVSYVLPCDVNQVVLLCATLYS
jgi:hypothetical protein